MGVWFPRSASKNPYTHEGTLPCVDVEIARFINLHTFIEGWLEEVSTIDKTEITRENEMYFSVLVGMQEILHGIFTCSWDKQIGVVTRYVVADCWYSSVLRAYAVALYVSFLRVHQLLYRFVPTGASLPSWVVAS